MSSVRYVLISLGASLVLGCTDGSLSTGPESEPSSFSMAAQGKGEAQQRHEWLKQLLKAEQERLKQEKELRKTAYEDARKAWKFYKRALKAASKGTRTSVDLLRCEPRPYEAEAAIIGPDGGTLQVGEHRLVIPRGALAQEELIVAEAPTNSLVELEFSPEGLVFDRPAELTLSYRRCEVPPGLDLLLAYIGLGNRVLELPPSWNEMVNREVRGEIGHFSRYAVAY